MCKETARANPDWNREMNLLIEKFILEFPRFLLKRKKKRKWSCLNVENHRNNSLVLF